MKVGVKQSSEAGSEKYGLQSDENKYSSSDDEILKSKPDERPIAQQSLLERIRSDEDLKQHGSQGSERKAEVPEGRESKPAPDTRATLQPSTLGRVQAAMARRDSATDAPISAMAATRLGGRADMSALSSGVDMSGAPATSTGPTTSTASTASTAPTTSASTTATKLLDRYDGGSGKASLNYQNDQRTAQQLAQYVSLSMTGMPPATISDQQAVAGLSAPLAQMDEQLRETYAVRALNVLQQPPVQRAGALAALTAEASQEVHRIGQDPARRLAAIFNTPVGAEYLHDGGRAQTADLRKQYEAFVAPGADDAAREGALKSAVSIRTQMQKEIGQEVATHSTNEQQAWDASTQRVNRILNEAEQYTAKNIRLPNYADNTQWNDRRAEAYAQTYGYQSIGEKLVSDDGQSQQERDNPGWWHRPDMTRSAQEKARDVLTFQQGLNDPNSATFRRVHALETQAVHELTANGDKGHYLDQVGKPKLYQDIGDGLPQADGHYVRNLAQKYLDASQDVDHKSRQMMREHEPDTLDKVLYAAGKVLNSLIPLPGLDWLAGQMLDVAVPNHGGLSSGEEAVLDTSLMVGGLLMGGLDRLPMLKGKFGLNEVSEGKLGQLHPVEPGVPPSLPETAPGEIGRAFGLKVGEAAHTPPGQTEKAPWETEPQKKEPGPPAGQSGSGKAGSPTDNRLPVPSTYEEPRPKGELDWHNGVFMDPKGGRHIEKDGHWYSVKYDADNRTLRVTHPQDASKPTYPVRTGPDGTYEVHSDVGLKGGAPKRAPELTPEQKQEMRRLFNEDKTHQEVADELGVPLGQVRQFAREETARWRVDKGKVSDEKKQDILDGLRRGLSVDDVAARTLVSRTTVRKVGGEAGVALLPIDRQIRIPIETRQRVADLLSEGLSGREVASQLGISHKTVTAIGREYHVVVPASARLIPPETRQAAIEKLRTGIGPTAVARELGIPVRTVARIAHETGVLSSGPDISPDTRQQVIERVRRRDLQKDIAKDLDISVRSVSRIVSRNKLEEIMAATFAGADPQEIDALSSNMGRRRARAPDSPQPGTSTGGETAQPGPAPKRARPDPEGGAAATESSDELIPAYMDELLDALGPEGLPLMQNLVDDVGLIQEPGRAPPAPVGSPQPGTSTGGDTGLADHPAPAGSPQPGTSTGGETGTTGYPELGEEVLRLLYADINVTLDRVSDDDVERVVRAWEHDNQNQ